MRHETQRVLDVFAGGATIPIEAAAIGAHVYALDNNELAYFIQLSLLRLSQVNPHQLPALVQSHGQSVLNQLTLETAEFFPGRSAYKSGRTIAYIWSRSTRCPSCAASLSLLKRPWLSKKNGRSIFLQRTPDHENRCYTRSLSTVGIPQAISNAWRGNLIECPFCQHVIDRKSMDSVLATHAYDELTAFCTTSRQGKSFFVCGDESKLVPSEDLLRKNIENDLAVLGHELPQATLPRWSGITNPTLYGIHKISDLFNIRQLAVLVKCCRLLHDEYNKCKEVHGTEIATTVVSFLSGLIDQLVDWNGRICMWIPQNEQVGRGLSGPGIPMMWDFVEVDPVETGPANLWDKLERIITGIKSIPLFDHLPEVVRGDARNLPFPDEYFDVVVTDPPYFDNIYYNILADCIYVWKRIALGDVLPDVFAAATTNGDRELSVSKYRHGTIDEAARFYTDGMTKALSEVWRVLKPDGLLAFFFAHSTVDGWASVVQSFRRACLDMVAAWEMQVERKHRPRGMRSMAVNTSFVLIGRRHHGEWPKTSVVDFEVAVATRLQSERDRFVSAGWPADDVGRSLFGIAVSLYAQAGNVYEDNEVLGVQEVLDRVAQWVEAMSPGCTIGRR